MTREQEVRDEVLLQLYGGRPLSISIGAIRKRARREGNDYTEQEIRQELFFQDDQGHAVMETDTSTGENKWRITSKGILKHENG